MTAESSGPAWVHELRPVPDVEHALRQMAALPRCVLFDSVLRRPGLGRYSFLAADPFEHLEQPASDGLSPQALGPLDRLQELLAEFPAASSPSLPPFQGGAAGLFGYELGRTIERTAPPAADEFCCPVMSVGLYDCLLAFDHLQDRAWIVSQGFPERDAHSRRQRAERRGRQLLEVLDQPPRPPWRCDQPGPLLPADLVPQHIAAGLPRLTSDFSRRQYQELVRRAVEYVHAGDVFQVNLSQRFLFPAEACGADDSLGVYLRLRRRNPATFAGYYDLGGFQLLSASPERFVSVRDSLVETRPIKGTRRRIDRPEADAYAGIELAQSEKDLAENVMIVDLLRNDLSRVCRADSVRVTQLCELESYEFVQHLVSAVAGRLSAGRGPVDLLRAAFPGGSITGAPKVRAMEIIAELEPTARGPYCGSLAYLGFDGQMDSSILIRTITSGRGWHQLPAGGGIVADSDPAEEYQETIDKARGTIRALLPI